MTSVHRIVIEASSYEDRKYISMLTESERLEVNGTLIQNLYRSVIERNTIDFGDIPDSMGDIEKVKYYDTTLECLNILKSAPDSTDYIKTSVSDVLSCISNMKGLKSLFGTGFRINHQFMQIMYNSMVMAIIDATSMLISDYVTYCMGADGRSSVNLDKNRGNVCLDNIRKFNKMYMKGDVTKSLNYMISEYKKSALGTTLVITTVVIGVLLAIVPLIRELVYFFYSSKVKLYNYLELEAKFLELNKTVVQASNKSAAEKKKILQNQEKKILELHRLADKLKVTNEDTQIQMAKEIAKDNSGYSLNNMENQMAYNKMNTSNNISFI